MTTFETLEWGPAPDSVEHFWVYAKGSAKWKIWFNKDAPGYFLYRPYATDYVAWENTLDDAKQLAQVLQNDLDGAVKKSLNEMMYEVVEFEKSKGWVPNYNQFGTSLALLHSEISESLESFRAQDWGSTVDGKPEGVSSELADVLIRLLSTWAQFVAPHGWDLESEYERKMAYNRTRPFRHGGKAV